MSVSSVGRVVSRAASRAPRHVALILDGNRRWARARGLPVEAGYRRGGERVLELLPCCERAGLEAVTLWPLSTENFARSPADLVPLVKVIVEVVGRLAAEGRWNLTVIGETGLLPGQVRDRLDDAVASGSDPRGMRVNLAVAYSGRNEIVRAIGRMLADRQREGVWDARTREVTDADVARYLDTAGQPDLDLIIRTSGEQRLSGFLLWQAAYAELYFCDVLWPDFTGSHLQQALDSYAARQRRFGH